MNKNFISILVKGTNSVIVIGLYFGFFATFSTGSSIIFLFRA